MDWNRVRKEKRRYDGRRYCWELSKDGTGWPDIAVVGTLDQIQSFCEEKGYTAISQHKVHEDDMCNPFILKLGA